MAHFLVDGRIRDGASRASPDVLEAALDVVRVKKK